ncbi:hypothetical protein HXX76_013244 [Chlamydomonas incerta]|uniref:Uncharacterized protein n=1 Tax=Chlamydomonas incerta TaxID=51695 RepID=A0A835SFK3_CHLIN|nr:hypothetical protein HXX76_013244 [Chlamydomonas incerta]|eukprot:KAG2426054.1 hypothetical protein HXX76_013244 [Chlamydomonas incerta]
MVRMVIETRPDPRLCGSEDCASLPPLAARGRSGKPAQEAARRRARKSRSTRSPAQTFASRIYWREVTNAELRQTRNAGLREAVSLAAQAGSRVRVPLADFGEGRTELQTKLDERIAAEWEVVPDVPEVDEYVML